MNKTAWQIANEYELLAAEYSRVLKADRFYTDMADMWKEIAKRLETGPNMDDSEPNYDRWGLCE